MRRDDRLPLQESSCFRTYVPSTYVPSTYWYLAFWVTFQILAAWSSTPGGKPGVAWFAHIGGFLAGIAFIACHQALKEAPVAPQGA